MYRKFPSTTQTDKNNFIAKLIYSEPVIYQTENTARDIQKSDQEKTGFKHGQTTNILVTLNNVINVKRCIGILYSQP